LRRGLLGLVGFLTIVDALFQADAAPHTACMIKGQGYLNGAWIEAAELSVPVDDLGFLLGVTVVERLRTFAGQPFRVDPHIRRLHRSLEIVGWGPQRISVEVNGVILEFATRNAALIAPGDDWSITAFVTPGKSTDAAHPTVCVHGGPLPFAKGGGPPRRGRSGVVARPAWPRRRGVDGQYRVLLRQSRAGNATNQGRAARH
jgi:branched-subunit amino acid aminotransferase/4-amino-4-deoxychorismate lyase